MIRPATALDIPRLVELGRQMHAESPRFERLRFDMDKLARTLGGLIASDDGFVFVAETELEIVGGLAGMVVEHWCSRDKVATDFALFMAPAHRGSMAGVRLVRTFITWAGIRGAKIVQLGVTTGIHVEQTEALYERIGLRRCGSIFEV